MFKPAHLQTGDNISLVSPVGLPPSQYRADIAIKRYLLDVKGLSSVNNIANSENNMVLVNSFNSAIGKKNKALFPVASNNFGESVVNAIDYKKFSELKPIFCTFSAASVLLHSIYERSSLVTFYGPNISFLHNMAKSRENPYTQYSFWNMLKSEAKTDGLNEHDSKYVFKWDSQLLTFKNIFCDSNLPAGNDNEKIHFIGEKMYQSGNTVDGLLLPSFLQSLKKALDFGISIDFSNKIVIVESDETNFSKCEDIIRDISQRSNLKESSAIVLASFITFKKNPPNTELIKELYDKKNVINFLNNVKKILNGNNPVIFGFPMGHLRYKLTIPYGVNSSLNIETGDLILNESPFSDI